MMDSRELIDKNDSNYEEELETASELENELKNKQKKSPWDKTNCFSRFFLFFMWPIVFRGEKAIDIGNNQFETAKFLDSKLLTNELERNYISELKSSFKPSFSRAIFKTFGPDLAFSGFLFIISEVICTPFQIVFMGWLIRDILAHDLFKSFQQANTTAIINNTTNLIDTNATITTEPAEFISESQIQTDIIVHTCLLLLFTWLFFITRTPYLLNCYHVALKCRIATMGLVYRKALRLNQSSLNDSRAGRFTNMLSNDIVRFDTLSIVAICLISSPLQVIFILFLMYQYYIGFWPTLASVVTILFITIIQTIMGSLFGKMRDLTAKRTDERIKLINELIVGIRIIKMYAWEEPLKLLVKQARKREINSIAITCVLKTVNSTLYLISDMLTTFASIVTYILLGNTVDAETVFVTVAFCAALKLPLCLQFPEAVGALAECLVSCRRINVFLKLEEHKEIVAVERIDNDDEHDNGKRKVAISYQKIFASWIESETSGYHRKEIILRNLSFELEASKLLLVIGRVGAGKSSLLMSILGELPILSGKIQINGKISYCSQEPWIFPGTLRDNILFGLAFDQDRYNEVIRVCSLTRDLEILPNGQMTLVGERGVALSGGQKARVNLARALYHRADIYLLDDPLSAVDAPVARDIFANAIKGFLKDKTVVLATHQLQFLQQADYLLALDWKQASSFGTVDQVLESQAFRELEFAIDKYSDGTSGDNTDTSKSRSTSISTSTKIVKRIQLARTRQKSISSALSEQSSSSETSNISETNDDTHNAKKTHLLDRNIAQKGNEKANFESSSSLKSILYYLNCAISSFGLVWFIIIITVNQFFIQYGNVYLSFWTDAAERQSIDGDSFVPIRYTDYLSQNQLILVFLAILLTTFTTCLISVLTNYWITLHASIRIHDKYFGSIVEAPIKFFDFHPIGMLLNRFGRDIGIIDELLPKTFFDIWTLFMLLASLIVLSIYIDLWNSISSIILVVAAFLVRAKLAKIIIKFKHLEGIRSDPVFSHISVSLDGLSTIRAFNNEAIFLNRCDHMLNQLSSVSSLCYAGGRLLSVTIDTLTSSFKTAIILMTVFSYDTISASTVGLIIGQVLHVSDPVEWGSRQLVEGEAQLTSVSRLKDYSNIEPEEKQFGMGYQASSLIDNSIIRPILIHSNVAIQFINVSLRYFQDEPYVLNDLNFSINRGENIGIVGRTGAGKSSIIATLFRLYPFEGSIEIDGQDIKYMSLKKLRSSIGIIPQDPVLFAGSIRKNLDPFGEHSDQELWSALEAVQLQMYFANTDAKLEHEIQESGSNLSVGQRQLICLARAIIRRNNILVLDEATANVDPETDAFIQSTIKEQFANCTVITIAHRLITIADSDRVLVLDQGQVKEFDEPYKLLQNKAGIFSQMVESTKKKQVRKLKQAIEDAHNSRAK